MSATEGEFVAAPPAAATSGGFNNVGKGRWFRACAQMRENPGQWMRFRSTKTGRNSVVQGLKAERKRLGGAQPGEFEATSRAEDDGYFVYARYIGGQVPTSPRVGDDDRATQTGSSSDGSTGVDPSMSTPVPDPEEAA